MKKIVLSAALLVGLSTGAFAQNMESVIGCWTMSSKPGEAIQLNRSGDFMFSDYNGKTRAFETMYGTWTLSGKTVTLQYEDRPRQRFTLTKTKGGWALTKVGGFWFAKAQPSDCRSEM